MYIVSDIYRLEGHNDLIKSLRKARRVMVVTGAGISVAGGIPDFRSQGGLFDQIKSKFHGTIRRGQELFDARWINGIRLILEEQLRVNHNDSEEEDDNDNDTHVED